MHNLFILWKPIHMHANDLCVGPSFHSLLWSFETHPGSQMWSFRCCIRLYFATYLQCSMENVTVFHLMETLQL